MERSRTIVVLVLTGVVVLTGCVGGTPTAETPATETPAAPATGTLDVHVINVGQSESTLVVGPTETMLIDTGNFVDDGRFVRQYLRERGIRRIDHLVLTHADADHIGGTAALIESLETDGQGVGAIYDSGIAASTRTYERYLDAVEEYNVTLFETRAGDRLAFADARVRVLGPPDPYLPTADRNENSIVFSLTHGQARFLFTGDAGTREEAFLLETYAEALDATVLKTGHHGSESSTTAPFLAAVDPAVATVSSSYDSPYGHPAEGVLDRLASRDVRTYWTATHGSVRLTSTGERITIATQQSAPTAPSALRTGVPVAPGTPLALEPRAIVWPANGTVTDLAATPSGDTAQRPPFAVVEIHADATGDDRTNLTDEYIVFENRGESTLDTSGWTVRDRAGATYTVPANTTLQPGTTLTLVTGAGTDTATTLYWNASQPVWNNDGDTITVTDAAGTAVVTEAYG